MNYERDGEMTEEQLQMGEMDMETRTRIRYPAKVKATVALEAIVGASTIAEIATKHGVHPVTVSTWKKELLERADEIFAKDTDNISCDCDEQTSVLYKKIGQLSMEVEHLRKST